MRIVFVVPAFNEAENVPRLLSDLESRPELWQDGGRLVLVDDGSSDSTADVAEAYAGPLPMEVLRQPTNRGPGKAFDRGFRRALEILDDDGLVVTLEADTTSDLDALGRMIAAAAAGSDVVLASVHAGGALVGVGRFRRLLSRAASCVMRHAAGLDARTVSSFFRVYRAEALRAAYDTFGDSFIRESGFACKAEILVRFADLRRSVHEVPVDLDASRRLGESKLRVLPTIGGYARLLARQTAARLRAPA
jgi:dolichol-phosphate mannosyltransferase